MAYVYTLSSFIDMPALHSLSNNIPIMSKTDVTKNRLALFSTINGDSFYGVRLWPNKYVKLFWQKPITDASTFQLFVFFGWQWMLSPPIY